AAASSAHPGGDSGIDWGNLFAGSGDASADQTTAEASSLPSTPSLSAARKPSTGRAAGKRRWLYPAIIARVGGNVGGSLGLGIFLYPRANQQPLPSPAGPDVQIVVVDPHKEPSTEKKGPNPRVPVSSEPKPPVGINSGQDWKTPPLEVNGCRILTGHKGPI